MRSVVRFHLAPRIFLRLVRRTVWAAEATTPAAPAGLVQFACLRRNGRVACRRSIRALGGTDTEVCNGQVLEGQSASGSARGLAGAGKRGSCRIVRRARRR